MSSVKTDVLILGGGPAGATAAIRLLASGLRPLIVEREQFPRYHVGESMTGECGAIVRELGFGDAMAAAGHQEKCGVNVFGVRGNSDWWIPVMQRTDDLRLRDQVTYQVRRSVFDQMLLEEALRRGSDFIAGRAASPLTDADGTVSGAIVRTAEGTTLRIDAGMTLDCTGQATFLANHKVTGPKYLGAYDKQIAIFSQVAGYRRGDGAGRETTPGNTHIFYRKKYHWAWSIPIDGQVTSVGIVVPAAYFRERGESKEDFVRRELGELNPGLSARVPEPELVEPVHVIPNYSFQVRDFAGPGYICLGDAHRFVDPIFSFGLYIAMKEAGLAADATVQYLAGRGRDKGDTLFRDYTTHIERGIDMLEDLIDAFWEYPLGFALLVHNRPQHRDAVVDIFAGRVFDGMHSVGRAETLEVFRKLLKRERSYEADGLYSVPIGSRYHPERAGIWNAGLDSEETTERWMRELQH
jgi:1H-pyrrole-2-carbonyl-[peptidyl-carrier protein] brominase